jgi:hypothetical protein
MSYIISFVCRPIRFCRVIWRKCTYRDCKFIIYMKSGNHFYIDSKSLEYEKRGKEYTKLEWERVGLPSHNLFTIDLKQIEAIVQEY